MNIFVGILIFAGVMRTVVLQGQEITSYFNAMQSLCFYLFLDKHQYDMES